MTLLEDESEEAIRDASVEVFNGTYSPFQFLEMVNKTHVIKAAETLLALTYDYSSRALAVIDEYMIQLPGGDDWKLGRQ